MSLDNRGPDIEWYCPNCEKWYPSEQWGDGDAEIPCELCGEHIADSCPNRDCWWATDHIWTERYERGIVRESTR